VTKEAITAVSSKATKEVITMVSLKVTNATIKVRDVDVIKAKSQEDQEVIEETNLLEGLIQSTQQDLKVWNLHQI
jgi:hypothetical protein